VGGMLGRLGAQVKCAFLDENRRLQSQSVVSEMAVFHHLCLVFCATAPTGRTLLALPHSLRTTRLADDKFVPRGPTLCTRMLSSPGRGRFLNSRSAHRTCILVVPVGFAGGVADHSVADGESAAQKSAYLHFWTACPCSRSAFHTIPIRLSSKFAELWG